MLIFRPILLISLCWILFAFPGSANADRSEDEERGFLDFLKGEKVQLFGSIELDHRFEEGFDDAEGDGSTTSNSDASVDLGLAVQPADWLEAELLLTWDDESPLEIDEAWVALGNTERFPLYVAGGKMTLPFGLYESAMISDPLTLEIGETKNEAALVGFKWHGLQAAVFAFDGSTEPGNNGNGLESFGGNVSYMFEMDEFSLLAGTSWVSNLEDSDGLSDYIDEENLLLKDEVPGIAAYTLFTWGPLNLAIEYIESLERPEFIEDGEVEKHDRQKAWTVDAFVDCELKNIELTFGLSYGETDGVGDLLPEKRTGGVISISPMEYVMLSIEYLREEDYPVRKDGTGDEADIVTLQLAFEF